MKAIRKKTSYTGISACIRRFFIVETQKAVSDRSLPVPPEERETDGAEFTKIRDTFCLFFCERTLDEWIKRNYNQSINSGAGQCSGHIENAWIETSTVAKRSQRAGDSGSPVQRGGGNNTREQRSERQKPSRKDAACGVKAQGFVGTPQRGWFSISKLGGTTDAAAIRPKILGLFAAFIFSGGAFYVRNYGIFHQEAGQE